MKSFMLAAALFAASTSTWAAPTLVNGSFDGATGWGVVPTPWSITNGSPDTNDMDHLANYHLPAPSTGYDVPHSASPDGGTWAGIALGRSIGSGNDSGPLVEAFEQLVDGFEPGKRYVLSWYSANFGIYEGGVHPEPPVSAQISVQVDGVTVGTTANLPVAEGWTRQSVSFTASATSHTLEFRALGTYLDPLPDGQYLAYLHVDGVTLAEQAPPSVTAVPVNGALPLTLLALTVAGAAFRRRQARPQG